jgi:hypothetical protein
LGLSIERWCVILGRIFTQLGSFTSRDTDTRQTIARLQQHRNASWRASAGSHGRASDGSIRT